MPPRGWIKCLKYLNRLHGRAGAISIWLYPFKKSRDNSCACTPPSETRTDNPYLGRNRILSSNWLQCTTSPSGKVKKKFHFLSVLLGNNDRFNRSFVKTLSFQKAFGKHFRMTFAMTWISQQSSKKIETSGAHHLPKATSQDLTFSQPIYPGIQPNTVMISSALTRRDVHVDQ